MGAPWVVHARRSRAAWRGRQTTYEALAGGLARASNHLRGARGRLGEGVKPLTRRSRAAWRGRQTTDEALAGGLARASNHLRGARGRLCRGFKPLTRRSRAALPWFQTTYEALAGGPGDSSNHLRGACERGFSVADAAEARPSCSQRSQGPQSRRRGRRLGLRRLGLMDRVRSRGWARLGKRDRPQAAAKNATLLVVVAASGGDGRSSSSQVSRWAGSWAAGAP
jgi:hypothetical protein